MVITVTLNPALDKTATIAPLLPGGLNRIQKSEMDAGGKGINVSKILGVLGCNNVATGFVGGSTGDALLRMLDDLPVHHAIPFQHDFVRVKGHTRINLKLLDTKNGITEINDPGVAVTEEEERLLVQKVHSLMEQHPEKQPARHLVVLAGSMHAGARPDFYKDMTRTLKEMGVQVFMDADGEAFAQAILAAPDFVKPNAEELLLYFGRDSDPALLDSMRNTDELILLCQELVHSKGVGMVALSCGADGAIFVTKEQCLVSPGLTVPVASTVGAGDSMVGAVAYAVAQQYSLEDTVRLAMACSAGAVMTEGTKAPSLQNINELLRHVTFTYK